MIFLMLVGLTHVSATASSQNAVISLKLKDVSLEEAVRSAEKQLKQDFFFNKQEIAIIYENIILLLIILDIFNIINSLWVFIYWPCYPQTNNVCCYDSRLHKGGLSFF